MSTQIQGYQLRELLLGTQIIKLAQTFPQTGQSTLFTVAGGFCMVTSLFGRVSTVLTTDPVLTLGAVPSTGTHEYAGIATTTVMTSAEVGTIVAVTSSAGLPTALAVMAEPAKAGSAVFLSNTLGLVVNTGTIVQSTGASEGGAIDWYLTYIPLTTGASIS